MLSLGAVFLAAAIVLGMAIPAILGRTADTPITLVQDVGLLHRRFVDQADRHRKYRTAYLLLGLLAGAGMAFIGAGVCLKLKSTGSEQKGDGEGR